jgi:hypothetical protein
MNSFFKFLKLLVEFLTLTSELKDGVVDFTQKVGNFPDCLLFTIEPSLSILHSNLNRSKSLIELKLLIPYRAIVVSHLLYNLFSFLISLSSNAYGFFHYKSILSSLELIYILHVVFDEVLYFCALGNHGISFVGITNYRLIIFKILQNGEEINEIFKTLKRMTHLSC